MPSPAAHRHLRRYADHASAWARRDPAILQAERTPYEVIHTRDIASLRYYPPLREARIEVDGEPLEVATETQPVPLVLVAPLAVNMLIYDLFPERSVVRYLRARGFELYLIDWGRPGRRHDAFSLGTYVGELMPEMLAKVRAHSGRQQLALHGWSFGGLFSLCYAAMSADPDIVSLALVGAPCDYHANGAIGVQYQRLSRAMRFVSRRTGFRVHGLRAGLLRSPGWANSLAFKLTSPLASARSYAELLRNMGDEGFVSAHATNSAFLDDMVAYPGAVVQDIVQHLWTDNVLAAGRLPIAGAGARLGDVKARVLLVCGDQDPIVTRACSAPIAELVGSEDVSIVDVPGGHMGILGGRRAPKAIWPLVADWLLASARPLS